MKMQYKHKWDPNTGLSICTIEYNGFKFYGYAQCSPEDEPYKSEMTGGNIATWRAELAYLKHIKRCEIMPKIQAYEHLLGTMIHSNQFDHTHYEYKRLWKEYNNVLNEYNELIDEIDDTNNMIKTYIEDKDKAYKARSK